MGTGRLPRKQMQEALARIARDGVGHRQRVLVRVREQREDVADVAAPAAALAKALRNAGRLARGRTGQVP